MLMLRWIFSSRVQTEIVLTYRESNMKTTQSIFRPVLSLMFLVLLISASPAFAASIIWEDDFTNNVTTGVDEHALWDTLVTELGTATTLNNVTMSGTFDTTGITCTDPTATQQIADLITSHTTGTVACDGHDWHYCVRVDETFDFWLDPPSSCSGSNCPDPGYIIRPKQQNSNWGGINSATCDAPSQSMKLEFGDIAIQPPLVPSEPVPVLSNFGLLLMAGLLLLIGLRIRRTS